MSLSKFGFTVTPSRKRKDLSDAENQQPIITSSVKKCKIGDGTKKSHGRQATHFRNEWSKGGESWLCYREGEGMFCRLGCVRNMTSAHLIEKLEVLAATSQNIAEVIHPEISGDAITSAFKCLYFLAKRRIPKCVHEY